LTKFGKGQDLGEMSKGVNHKIDKGRHLTARIGGTEGGKNKRIWEGKQRRSFWGSLKSALRKDVNRVGKGTATYPKL